MKRIKITDTQIIIFLTTFLLSFIMGAYVQKMLSKIEPRHKIQEHGYKAKTIELNKTVETKEENDTSGLFVPIFDGKKEEVFGMECNKDVYLYSIKYNCKKLENPPKVIDNIFDIEVEKVIDYEAKREE